MALRARHNTSDSQYRNPFGAVLAGGAVSLCIDVWDEPLAEARLRIWIDDKGEKILNMDRIPLGDQEAAQFGDDVPVRFGVTIEPEEPEVIWYSFQIVAADGAVWRYGVAREHGCGEGAFAFGEPPSFQITVYQNERKEQPDWYKNGIVYQIFPDRFYRGKGWEKSVEAAFKKPHNAGPGMRFVDDWFTYPRYDKTQDGRIANWDFYGGTLNGIREKLPYLEALGITVIYLNPIFEAASNHRYDTANYLKIDPMLGTEADFRALCQDASARGISIILDGVFNHVGADSLYFNKYGNYGSEGAAQPGASAYDTWFDFNGDGSYKSWWGVDDLPDVNEDSPDFRELICGHDGVIRKWLRLGARGWRLDVADELSDDFISEIKAAALAEKPDAVVIGEVWEDATNKFAYNRLRHYFWGSELDGTMNYPLRQVLLDFLTNRVEAAEVCRVTQSLMENYPPEAFASELNLLGSHDRIRLLTILGNSPEPDSLGDYQRYAFRLDKDHTNLAVSRLWVAALLQMTLPGVPSIYYGDEAGLQGYGDPYNRAAFPWRRENKDCFDIYRNAVAIRKSLPVFTDGDYRPFAIGRDVFGFWREDANSKVCVLVNASLDVDHTVTIPLDGLEVDDVVSGKAPKVEDGNARVFLWPLGTAVLNLHKAQRLQKPMDRGMGVVCHVTSLPNPGRPGKPGTLGDPAYRFIDYLAAGGQRYWQVLPVNPTDHFGSPYAGLSAFAGNVALMWGYDEDGGTSFSADFEGTREYRDFLQENEEWLIPYATFRAIKRRMGEKSWQEWPERYREYSGRLAHSKELAADVRRECAVQFEFMRQWGEVRAYANARGVKIVGDMPMYVSADSSDVWAERRYFRVDEAGYPASQAGCPPDSFSADGQLWGNPTYRWDVMRADGYRWWMRRFKRAFELYDYVRLDHFLGFSSYYSIPNGKLATEGAWNFGPGLELFRRAYQEFGPLPVVAEDLGTVTPAVRALVSATGFPGMDVVQFYNDDPAVSYVPAPDKMVYSSTHDTNTLLGWVREHYGLTEAKGALPDEVKRLRAEAVAKADRVMENCLAAPADVAMVTLQDVMRLDETQRMNVPGTATGNWSWRADEQQLEDSQQHLRDLAEKSGRI